ncbi:hypothetical protein LTR17_022033 [Elasticomyces elasticus]|nr:hypothetical protein LTR17_022033 [Elasticomyces elasticus]
MENGESTGEAMGSETTYDKEYVLGHLDQEFHYVGNRRWRSGATPLQDSASDSPSSRSRYTGIGRWNLGNNPDQIPVLRPLSQSIARPQVRVNRPWFLATCLWALQDVLNHSPGSLNHFQEDENTYRFDISNADGQAFRVSAVHDSVCPAFIAVDDGQNVVTARLTGRDFYDGHGNVDLRVGDTLRATSVYLVLTALISEDRHILFELECGEKTEESVRFARPPIPVWQLDEIKQGTQQLDQLRLSTLDDQLKSATLHDDREDDDEEHDDEDDGEGVYSLDEDYHDGDDPRDEDYKPMPSHIPASKRRRIAASASRPGKKGRPLLGGGTFFCLIGGCEEGPWRQKKGLVYHTKHYVHKASRGPPL